MKDKDQYLGPVIGLIRFGIVGLAALTPLFFLPITSEFYQFNKQVLLVVVTAVLLVIWGVRMGIEGKVRIVRTPLDIPMLIFGLAFILATIFSVDRYISIAGFYPRFHGSLVSALAYIVLYFVAVSNLDGQSRKWLVWAFLGSGVVLAIQAIASFFGYPLFSADYAKGRAWSPIGNPATLSLYLALVLPIVLGLIVTTKNRSLQTIYVATAIVIMMPIVLFKLTGAILATLAGLVVVGLFLPKVRIDKETKTMLAVFGVAIVAFALINFIPGLRQTFLEPLLAKKQTFNLSADKTLPLDSAWRISTQAVGQRPFFGVGPGTFAYSFTAMKGLELNSDSLWNLRFDLAGNEYLTVLSSLGIVGLVAFAFILVSFLRSVSIFNLRSGSVTENPTSVFLLSSFVVLLVGIFFQDTTASIWIFLVLLAALTYSYLKDSGVKGVEEVDVKFVALTAGAVQFAQPSERNRDSSIGTAVTIVGVIFFLGTLWLGYPTYQAEATYFKALKASAKDKAAETRDNLLVAIKKNPNRDTYRRSLVVLDRLLATNLSRKEKKSDQDNKNIAGLVNESIQQGVVITGYQGQGLNSFSIKREAGTSPLNVANWEALSGVLSSLDLEGDLKNKNAADAINVAQQAVALDPKNPLLLEALGNILLKNNLVDNAIQAYEQAINVRPRYASAHYNLATALRQKGDNPTRVVFELQNTQNLLPSNSPDKDRIAKELKEAQDKVNQATAAAAPKTTPPPIKTTE